MGRPRNKGLGAAYASMSERFTTKSWRVTEGNCRCSWAATLVVGIGSERQRSAERNHVHFVQRRRPNRGTAAVGVLWQQSLRTDRAGEGAAGMREQPRAADDFRVFLERHAEQ